MRIIHQSFGVLHRPQGMFGCNPGITPLNISGLQGWYDFSDATTLYTDAGSTLVSSDGDLIYQANDKSGNGNNAVQATEANRPVYKVNIQNGLSIARLDAVAEQFWTVSSGMPTDNNSITAFLVSKSDLPDSFYTSTGARHFMQSMMVLLMRATLPQRVILRYTASVLVQVIVISTLKTNPGQRGLLSPPEPITEPRLLAGIRAMVLMAILVRL